MPCRAHGRGRCLQSCTAVCAPRRPGKVAARRPPGAEPDPFTAQMQRRTEEELRALLAERTQGDEHDAADDAEEAEDEVRVVICVFTLLTTLYLLCLVIQQAGVLCTQV